MKNTYKKTRLQYRYNLIEKGLCANCCKEPLETAWLCKKCNIKQKIASKKCYYKNHEKYKKRNRENVWQRRFGGLRTEVIKRDSHSCQVCGYNKKIRIHHINENNKDNRLENLIVLCIICHTVVERINKNLPVISKLFPSFLYVPLTS